MAISSITYTGTDLIGQDDLSNVAWVGAGINVTSAGDGPTADYTAYTLTSTGGTAFINYNVTGMTNAAHFLEVWVKRGPGVQTNDTARGYIRNVSNFTDSSSILYGEGTAGDTGTGIGTITGVVDDWTLWGIDLGTVPSGTGSVRFGPNELFGTTAGDDIILCAPRLQLGSASGWTITEGAFTPLSHGKIGIIGQPLRGKM